MQSSHYLDPFIEKVAEILISNTKSEVVIYCPWLIYYYLHFKQVGPQTYYDTFVPTSLCEQNVD